MCWALRDFNETNRVCGRHQELWGPTRDLSDRAASQHIVQQVSFFFIQSLVFVLTRDRAEKLL